MIQEIKLSQPYNIKNQAINKNNCSFTANSTSPAIKQQPLLLGPINNNLQVRTALSDIEKKKYLYLLDCLKNVQKSPNSPDLAPFGQLDLLLRNGKLLSKSNHDNSTTLDNLYLMATTERAQGLDKISLLTSTLDLLCNPRFATQTFGDIPDDIKSQALNKLPSDNPVKFNPESLNVITSGTCAAASIEVNMADKYPAEFTRWINGLSSKDMNVALNVNLKSICKNPLEALEIIKLLKANKNSGDLNQAKIKVDLDAGAVVRAHTQTKHWNEGERSVVDVLIQSAIMKLGSQNTYDSLTDTRAGDFNSNPQGLIELEKTFVESLIKNKEITSLVYHKIDDEQNLIGYNCSLDKISKHITDTIDSGDDVILGYVLTNETAGITTHKKYNPDVDGAANKVINGHEITVVDYYKDEQGKIIFVCVDTDDNSPDLVQYSADWLLPKIHHAGYPAHLVRADEKEIMKQLAA
ncbi:MAG: hypothetical protein IKU37_04405 [Candidatus Gastranaerophilales bacterium]|nr:hypothetical protein [Candidatus Gastranaerophilales bacterium]